MPDQQQILSFLPWVRSFEAAARRKTFTGAARELGLTQAAVSQQIGLLESALGEKLFERQRRGVTITAAGAAFLPHVQSAFRALTRSAGELFGGQANQRIVIHCPISFAALWLSPRLPTLSHDLPRINFDIKTIFLPRDLDSKSTDFDIQFGNGHFSGRTAQRLTHERLVPVASPRVVDSANPDAVWKQLPLLNLSGAREMWAAWFDAAGEPNPGLQTHRFDSFIAALAAAQAGAGILLGSRPLIDGALERGELVTLSEIEIVSENSHFISYDSDMALDHTSLAFLDWLKLMAN
jgi:LysR family transcriptional regulator of beta-lactamase